MGAIWYDRGTVLRHGNAGKNLTSRADQGQIKPSFADRAEHDLTSASQYTGLRAEKLKQAHGDRRRSVDSTVRPLWFLVEPGINIG
jgi:hypothetical protein